MHPLLTDNADALAYVVAGFDFVEHSHSKVSVGDDGLSAVVQREFLAAKNVLSGALTIGLEVACGGDVGPADVLSLAKLGEGLGHRKGKRLKGVGEIRGLSDRQRVLGVHVEAARSADDQQASVGAGEDIAQVSQSR